MEKWRRGGLIASAVVALAAVLQTVPPPPELSADHGDSNPGYEWVSAADQVVTTDNYWHNNHWICYNQAAINRVTGVVTHGCTSSIGTDSATTGNNPTTTTICHARGTDRGDANSNGCNNGHDPSGGWTFNGHWTRRGKIAGSTLHHCPVTGKNVTDPSHCGTWVELCPAGSDPAVEHRHETGTGHRGCETHTPPVCIDNLPADQTRTWAPGHGHAGQQINGCGLDLCPAGQHRHGSGDCEPDHQDRVCEDPVTVPVTLTWTGHDADGNDVTKTLDCEPPVCEAGQILQNGVCVDCPAGQSPNADGSACEPDQCPPGQHRHTSDPHTDCRPAHTLACIAGLSSDQTRQWTPDHPGHAAVQVPGCDPVTVTICGSGQHYHAAVVPGGHQGCRTAHTAPSCTWNSAGTWSPGHGGQASDGHTTTTGMRVCVSVRQFCVDNGADNALEETVGRQNPLYWTDGRGLLGDAYHRDRIPYGRNLAHPQFKPRLTLGGQTSPAGRSRLPAGEWVTAATGCNTNSHTDTAQMQY